MITAVGYKLSLSFHLVRQTRTAHTITQNFTF